MEPQLIMDTQPVFGRLPENLEELLNSIAPSPAALERPPEFSLLMVRHHPVEFQQHSWQAFVEDLKEYAEQHPDDPDVYLHLGVAYSGLGDWEEAASASIKAMELMIDSEENPQKKLWKFAALFILGFAYASLSSLKDDDFSNVLEAEKSFQKAIEIRPDFAEAHFYLGALYMDLGRWEEAEECFRKVISIDPNHSKAYAELGWLAEHHNQSDEALSFLERAVKADPENLVALKNLSRAYIALGHWLDAINILQQVIKIVPHDADAFHGLGVVYLGMDNLEKAEELIRRALQLKPDDPSIHSDLGLVSWANGKIEEAKVSFQKALRLDPNFLVARMNLVQLFEQFKGKAEEAEDVASDSPESTGYVHIALNETGIPIIAGTTTKVLEIVSETQVFGWSPEEIHFQHPYLSLAQIYSALAYYEDHAEEIDTDIERRHEMVNELRDAAGPSKIETSLRSKGLL